MIQRADSSCSVETLLTTIEECMEAKKAVDVNLMNSNANQANLYLEEAGINAEACLGPACKPFNTLLEDYTYCCQGCCMAGDFK